MPLHDKFDTSLGEVATRIGIPLVALIALAVFGGGDPRSFRSALIGFAFLAAFSALVILMRFEMGRRRFWLVGVFVAFVAFVACSMV
jgi:hypothetical protein